MAAAAAARLLVGLDCASCASDGKARLCMDGGGCATAVPLMIRASSIVGSGASGPAPCA
jgi:hypothetical protein